MASIKWLSEVSDDDIILVGRNFYDLSKMYKARLPVANGFCITKEAFTSYLSNSGVNHKIENLLSQANIESKEALNMIAGEIRKLIINSEIGSDLRKEIAEAYNNMSISTELHGLVNAGTMSLIKAGRELPYITASNSYSDNFNWKNECISSIKGIDNVVNAVRKCWAESINGDILSSIIRKQASQDEIYPAIAICKMINSSRSGLAHINGDKIIIKAQWGLAGLADIEQIKPDVYVIGDNELSIKDIEINNQAYAYVRDDSLGETAKKEIPLSRRSIQILSEAEIKRLAKVMTDITDMIGEEKNVEWAVEEGRLYITGVKKFRNNEVYQDEVYDENVAIDNTETITEVSLDLSDIEEEINAKADGAGLIESMLVQNKDEYFYYIRDGMEDAAVNGIADKLVKIASNFNKKEVWYKIIDRPEKFYDWRYELEKEGKQDELIGLEIAAIRKAMDNGFKNIGLLMPLVNDAEKVRSIKQILRKAGLDPGVDIRIGALIDNPAAVHMIDEILEEGLNFVSIDVNRLARYSLAAKKDEINAMHPAVIKQIKNIVDAAKKKDVKTGVCNFNASFDIIEKFVNLGIDNIAARNDELELARKSVARVEKKLLLSVARDSFRKKA